MSALCHKQTFKVRLTVSQNSIIFMLVSLLQCRGVPQAVGDNLLVIIESPQCRLCLALQHNCTKLFEE
jgi:hypothetical protein